MILIMVGIFCYCFPTTRRCCCDGQNLHVELPEDDNGQQNEFINMNFGNAPADGAAAGHNNPQANVILNENYHGPTISYW